jgi:hypothetical protein
LRHHRRKKATFAAGQKDELVTNGDSPRSSVRTLANPVRKCLHTSTTPRSKRAA